MNRKAFFGTVAVLAVVGLVYWLFLAPPAGWPIKHEAPTSPVIVLFGDSLAYGFGATDHNEHGLTGLLSRHFGRPVVNFGMPGDTTNDGLRRVDQALATRPGLVIVSLGGNDYLRGLPRADIFANLRKVVERFHERGAAVCIIGLEPVASFGYTYKKDFVEVARSTGAILIPDAMRGILDRPSLRADNLHANNEGYKVLADRVIAAIAPVVAKMPPPPAKQ